MEQLYPGLLQALADNGQHPPFVMFDCSDSRVSEPLIFSSRPGDIFTARNIANQFQEDDITSTSVLGYAVEHLQVKHVIVMGHYGCGGIQAAILPPPSQSSPADEAVQRWIQPIRELYHNSTRQEIVAFRESRSQKLDLHAPAFRALVEENVKSNVLRISASDIIKEHYTSSPEKPVFIHGFVYDIESGKVCDLRVSIGPPGVDVPIVPLPGVEEL
ncbi:carbonic anhydrase [Pluteus cervinus]|uniref:Carbonic anhydrase n=1 Tax=Pluteus cervinus TaxID=181527 RepID=A0ACD3B7R1_9AGAR|nr:carbonic anhydrase [Pluteus cervinus]